MIIGSAQPPQGGSHDGTSVPRGGALFAEPGSGVEHDAAAADPDEAALIERSIRGDKDAYRVIVEKYQRRLMACAFDILKSREDAEDIVQEAFVKSFFALKGFRGGSSLSTWFHRIVFNLSIDLKRKFRRRGGDPVEFDERTSPAAMDVGGVAITPEHSLEQQEVGSQIRKALEQLSDEHRQAIVLREVEGLSYEEIAEVVGISVGTVMSRLFYARKRLQAVLRDLR